MIVIDRAWCEAVVAHLQPVFDEDGSDWTFQWIEARPRALLWEASPTAFVARHPDAGIEDSYGQPASAIPCLDFWVYLDRGGPSEVELSWEGWNHWPEAVTVSGDPETDGRMIAGRLRAHLRLDGGPVNPRDGGSLPEQ